MDWNHDKIENLVKIEIELTRIKRSVRECVMSRDLLFFSAPAPMQQQGTSYYCNDGNIKVFLLQKKTLYTMM